MKRTGKVLSLALLSLLMTGCSTVTSSEKTSTEDSSSEVTDTSTNTTTDATSSTSHHGGPDGGHSGGGNPGGGGGGGSSSSVSWKGATEITSDQTITSGRYTSSTADQNAVLVNGSATVSISNVTITKTGDSSGGDSTSFYGINSGLLAKSGAKVTLTVLTVTTDATGGNGVFCYGGSATTNNSSSDGSEIDISSSSITTSKDNSGGVMVSGGGVLKGNDLTVETSGISSAAIRSDRGGGNMTIDGGTYTTNGSGSPAVYCTADVTVKNAILISNVAEGAIVEGKNSITFDNVTLNDTHSKLNGKSTTYKNIFLYQSMSGDADSGSASFSATDSTFTTNKGDSIYITNTSAEITLENNTFTNKDSDSYFLRAQADSWGTSGSNGGEVTLNMKNQDVSGNIYIDSVSTLTMSLTSGSTFTGAIDNANVAKNIALTLSSDSKLTLTGDTYVDSLTNADTTNSNIVKNGHNLYVNGTAI